MCYQQILLRDTCVPWDHNVIRTCAQGSRHCCQRSLNLILQSLTKQTACSLRIFFENTHYANILLKYMYTHVPWCHAVIRTSAQGSLHEYRACRTQTSHRDIRSKRCSIVATNDPNFCSSLRQSITSLTSVKSGSTNSECQ